MYQNCLRRIDFQFFVRRLPTDLHDETTLFCMLHALASWKVGHLHEGIAIIPEGCRHTHRLDASCRCASYLLMQQQDLAQASMMLLTKQPQEMPTRPGSCRRLSSGKQLRRLVW